MSPQSLTPGPGLTKRKIFLSCENSKYFAYFIVPAYIQKKLRSKQHFENWQHLTSYRCVSRIQICYRIRRKLNSDTYIFLPPAREIVETAPEN